MYCKKCDFSSFAINKLLTYYKEGMFVLLFVNVFESVSVHGFN
jgi:hypothetical protein